MRAGGANRVVRHHGPPKSLSSCIRRHYAHIEIKMTSPTTTPHFQGLRTVLYHAPDLDKAKAWYSRVLGIAPYFDQPFYVGFSVGGYELGLDPDASTTPGGSGGVAVYWGVTDAQAALARLLSLGATERSSIQDVGDGIRVATVLDPFGNIFGIIQNPHFSLPQT